MEGEKKRVDEYTTEQELKFLNGILTDAFVERNTRQKIKAISGYIASAPKRKEWDSINKGKVLRHAENLLDELLESQDVCFA